MVMNLRKRYESDPVAEVEGVWVEIDPDAKARVKVARFNNPEHEKCLEKLRKPYRNMRSLPKSIGDKIMNESMAEAILMGWENISLDGKKALPYSRENALKLLSDPEMHDFRETVLSIALEAESYRKSSLEEAAGNSPSASNTESSGPESA